MKDWEMKQKGNEKEEEEEEEEETDIPTRRRGNHDFIDRNSLHKVKGKIDGNTFVAWHGTKLKFYVLVLSLVSMALFMQFFVWSSIYIHAGEDSKRRERDDVGVHFRGNPLQPGNDKAASSSHRFTKKKSDLIQLKTSGQEEKRNKSISASLVTRYTLDQAPPGVTLLGIPTEQADLLHRNDIEINKNVPPICFTRTYDIESLPHASIIIPFYNEAWPNMWRTLTSIYLRTPHLLIHEIILLDDFNTQDAMTPIEDMLFAIVHHFPLVHVYRTKAREGLIHLKNIGVDLMTEGSEVIVFLEGHTEVQPFWYEPLALQLITNPQSILLPMHDIIQEDTGKYEAILTFMAVGSLDCKMIFTWQTDVKATQSLRNDPFQPIASPTMPGGLLAMSRKWWYELGVYDEDMQVWGGENIEMSLRAWRCGGSIEMMPCSHVGHLFRKKFTYDLPSVNINENIMRVAALWTSLTFRKRCGFFEEEVLLHPGRLKSLAARRALQERLQCQSMDWYLNKFYPRGYPYDEFHKSFNNESISKRRQGMRAATQSLYPESSQP